MNHIIEDSLAFNLSKACRLITKRFNEYLESSGVKYTQLCILLKFAEQSAQDSVIPYYIYSSLGKELGLERTSVVRSVDRLVQNGFLREVTGKKKAHHRKQFSLTKKGQTALAEALKLYRDGEVSLKSSLEIEECPEEKVLDVLNQLIMAIH